MDIKLASSGGVDNTHENCLQFNGKCFVICVINDVHLFNAGDISFASSVFILIVC